MRLLLSSTVKSRLFTILILVAALAGCFDVEEIQEVDDTQIDTPDDDSGTRDEDQSSTHDTPPDHTTSDEDQLLYDTPEYDVIIVGAGISDSVLYLDLTAQKTVDYEPGKDSGKRLTCKYLMYSLFHYS